MAVSFAAPLGRRIDMKPRAEDLADTYPPGRRCIDPCCITVLCRFNPGPWCYLHAQRRESELLAAEGLA